MAARLKRKPGAEQQPFQGCRGLHSIRLHKTSHREDNTKIDYQPQGR